MDTPPEKVCDSLPAPRFDLREFGGSLGDLGTLLPIAIGMILLNGLDGTAVFLGIGLFYVLAGLYFGITVPVQPMKVIGAYAIAQSLSPVQISAAGLWMALILLVLAATGTITMVGKLVPRSTVRGVQLTTGVLLMTQGLRFVLGETSLQKIHGATEPFLSVSAIGPVPLGIVLGLASMLLILLLLANRRVPATLVMLAAGLVVGLSLGGHRNLADFHFGFHLPELLPYGWPDMSVLLVALTALALPQLPMTIGNAVVAQADLTKEYFGQCAADRSSFRALAVSMGLANLFAALIGAMPMCHGSGGLAAHYRFGSRTFGSNLMIGAFFLLIALFIGDRAVHLLSLLPLSMLGALLIFTGAELGLTMLDLNNRKDGFVVIIMLGTSLVTNLAVGFLAGFVLAMAFKSKRLEI